jgi:tetraprenyl-beta-curcumene synthase
MSAIGTRSFVARAGFALACAHSRYWLSVAPLVRNQLRRWERRAAQIPDPRLQELACDKMRNERFNVEVAAMIATIAPSERRGSAVEAIVALQLMYDYLDALTEQPTADPIRDGLQCSQAFIDAVTISAKPIGDYYAYRPDGGDAGYLEELAHTVRGAIMQLPAIDAISEIILMSAARCSEAQVRIHATQHLGTAQLEGWAVNEAEGTGLQWREWLFGAMGSVVAAHALIALAADDRATAQQASEIDDTYLSICVLTTVLDHLVDHDGDVLTGEQTHIHLYETHGELAEHIAMVMRRVIEHARVIRNGPHHVMILSGVVAYYTSQPSAQGEFAYRVAEHTQKQLRPLITPTLATMRAWRTAKRLRVTARCATRRSNGRRIATRAEKRYYVDRHR